MNSKITPAEFLNAYPPPLRELANALRMFVKEIVPDAVEGVNGWGLLAYRVQMGKKSAYWGWIGADGDHAHLGFEYGILLHDPKNLLEGHNLRQVRYVTIRHPREIRKRDFAKLVRQAVEIAQRSDKRALLKLEQDARGI
ncbi:MAG: DUF1801 domain-containing protein [Chloroflexota bacterium]|nr:MAG: DUF1801 domain-containing protein [Chloroflexota bacterium]